MFGAWQAGAWRSLASRFKPDLVVGASVGSLNGYAIAAGWSASDLCAWWQRPDVAGFEHLPKAIRLLMDARPLEIEYAVVLVDLLRMKPHTVTGSVIQAEHLLASCAVPGAALPRRIEGRWYLDGGLLNPLPVWAAVELGATHIVALNALPDVPSALLKPLVKGFRACFGHRPPAIGRQSDDPSSQSPSRLAPRRVLLEADQHRALDRAGSRRCRQSRDHNYLGITASQKGWQEAAEKEMLDAIAVNPDYADAHFNLAVVYATNQPPAKEQAKLHYVKATSLGAEPDPALEKLLALGFSNQGAAV